MLGMLGLIGIGYPIALIAFAMIWHFISWIFSFDPYIFLWYLKDLYGPFNKEIACVTIFGLYIFCMHSEYELWKKRNKR